MVSYAALEQLKYSIDNDPALEVYSSVLRTLDAFGRMMNNLKTNLIHFNKKFKRSELKFYHESTTFGIQNLYKSGHFDSAMSVPIPSGMKVSYLEATQVITELYHTLNIEDTLSKLTAYFTGDHVESPEDLAKEIDRVTRNELQERLRHIFVADKTVEVPASKVFKNLAEVKEVDNLILQFDAVFKMVPLICNKIDFIDKEIDTVVTNLEQQKGQLDRKYVEALHTLVLTAAVQFDAFGTLLAESQRIEHNFVIVLQRLVRAAARF